MKTFKPTRFHKPVSTRSRPEVLKSPFDSLKYSELSWLISLNLGENRDGTIPAGRCWIWSSFDLLTGGPLTLFSCIQKGLNVQRSLLISIHLYKYGLSKVGQRVLMFVQSHRKYDGTSEFLRSCYGLILRDLKV